MTYNTLENYRAHAHKEVTTVGATLAGAIIKATNGHFDRRGPQAQPRQTPWDEKLTISQTKDAASEPSREIPSDGLPQAATDFET